MPEEAAANQGAFPKLRQLLGYYGELQTLFSIAAPFGVSTIVLSKLPGGWHPPHYWMLAGFAFFGTAFVVALLNRITKWMIRRVRNTRLDFSADSGKVGCVGLRLYGSPTAVTAHGRIVRMLNGGFNPSPHRFECQLSKGGQGVLERSFTNGDWAHIILGSEHSEQYGGGEDDYEHRGLSIHRGNTVVHVPDTGAVVEIEFECSPPLVQHEPTFTKRFSVAWVNNHVEIAEVNA